MKGLKFTVLLLILVLSSPLPTFAAQSHSTNYEVNEVQFGSGGLVNASSPNYKAQQSVGSTGVGQETGTNYKAYSGFLTPSDPFLSIIVNGSNLSLGQITTSTAATGTGTFSVTAYVDSGYVVESVNNPPTAGPHTINAMTSAAASSPGTEQFGINMVQNQTSCATPAPANFGANPVPEPNSSFANGIAATGYNTCGLFKYNPGDVIAESSGNGWGETNYTISYLMNVSASTPGGTYTMTENLVAVATY
jgi:hypothetical protein